MTFGASLLSQLEEGRRGLLSIPGRKEERNGWRERRNNKRIPEFASRNIGTFMADGLE